MKINKISYNNLQNKTLKNQISVPFYGICKMPDKISKVNTAAIIGGTAAAVIGGIIAAKRGLFGSLFKKSNFRPWKNINQFEKTDVNEMFKKDFIKHYIDPITNPRFMERPWGTEKMHPRNGYLVYGPDSKAKSDYFNWMLSKLEKAGAEIIDPGNGGKVKNKELHHAWSDLWNSYSPEEFKKTGKYKVFVVRGLDEIGQSPYHDPKRPHPFPEGFILKDNPDSSNSCEKNGIMLFYDCINPSKLDPAVIRTGRVDVTNLVQPYPDESLDIWKDYLKWAGGLDPSLAFKKFADARKILAARGSEVMKEMESHLKFFIPYHAPRFEESLKMWSKFIKKVNENGDINIKSDQLMGIVEIIRANAKNPKTAAKHAAILKMMDDIQLPEHKEAWKYITETLTNGGDPTYGLAHAAKGFE